MKVVQVARTLEKPDELLAVLSLPNHLEEVELWESGRMKSATIRDIDGARMRVVFASVEVLT